MLVCDTCMCVRERDTSGARHLILLDFVGDKSGSRGAPANATASLVSKSPLPNMHMHTGNMTYLAVCMCTQPGTHVRTHTQTTHTPCSAHRHP